MEYIFIWKKISEKQMKLDIPRKSRVLLMLRDYFDDESNAHRFAEWAWGSDYDGARCESELIAKWNDYHYDEYRPRGDEGFWTHIENMIGTWKDNK